MVARPYCLYPSSHPFLSASGNVHEECGLVYTFATLQSVIRLIIRAKGIISSAGFRNGERESGDVGGKYGTQVVVYCVVLHGIAWYCIVLEEAR